MSGAAHSRRGRWRWVGRVLALALVCAAGTVVPTGALAQDASVRVDVSTRSMSIDDELTLSITAEGSYEEAYAPDLSEWQVTGSYKSQQLSFVMGRQSKQTTTTYTLTPKRDGALTIGSAKLTRGGQVVAQSQPVVVNVRKVAETPALSAKQAADLQRHSGEIAFIQPTVSEQTLYEGQPFVLTYDLWVVANTSVADRGVGATPTFDAFSVTDLLGGNRGSQTRKRLGNQLYTVLTIKQDLLVPLSAGKQRIGPLELKLVAGDFFNQRRLTAKAPPLDVDVRAVPEAGRPASYRAGQIGAFVLSAQVDRTTVVAGERVVVTVTASGRGNLAALKAPDFPAVPGVQAELLPGKDQPKIATDASGMHGEVSFSYIAVPSKAGKLTIPSFTLGAFNPLTGGYQEVQSQPLTIEVEASSAAATAGTARPQGLRPIIAEPSLVGAPRGTGVAGALFWVTLLLPALLFVGAEVRARVLKHREAHADVFRIKGAAVAARRALSALSAGQPKGSSEELQQISSVLARFLQDRFGIAPGATREHVRFTMLAQKVSDDAVLALLDELDQCDFARFAPSAATADGVRQAAQSALSLVERLEREGSGAVGGPP